MSVIESLYKEEEKKLEGEWQTDKNGRRFKKFGSSVIYETEFLASSTAYQKKAVKNGSNHPENDQKAAVNVKECPFLTAGFNRAKCREDCAFFANGSCCFCSPNRGVTKGKCCPFFRMQKCADTCALFDKKTNSCMLAYQQKGE